MHELSRDKEWKAFNYFKSKTVSFWDSIVYRVWGLGLGSGEEERQAELDGDIPVFPSHPLQSQAVLWPPSPFQARPFE